MKRFLVPVVLLTFLFTSFANGGTLICRVTGLTCPEINSEGLVERKGLFYYRLSETPFTGTVTGKERGSIKNGKWDGPYIRYHSDGGVKVKGTYSDGLYHGVWLWYFQSGKLETKQTYKRDSRDGPYLNYYKNGQLRAKGSFKNDKYDGPFVWYYQDGQLWSQEIIKTVQDTVPG